MDATRTTQQHLAFTQLFTARYARLQALHAMLARMPDSAWKCWRQRLVARALYSTWADLESLPARPA